MIDPIRQDATASTANSNIVAPPKTLGGIARQLGPGLIIAGSIVGSGELIATTKTGAQAGISLLWLIIIGCVIKVFAQIELGRHAITHGETTLTALNRIPGPRLRVNWIIWYWLIMMLILLGQVGGIVGGVGQALAIAFPINGDYRRAIQLPSETELKRYIGWRNDIQNDGKREFSKLSQADQTRLKNGQQLIESRLNELSANEKQRVTQSLQAVESLIGVEQELAIARQNHPDGTDSKSIKSRVRAQKQRVRTILEPTTRDDKYWALTVTLITIAILFRGRYGVIQSIATALVVSFTLITIGNVIALEFNSTFQLSGSELLSGLWPQLPESLPAPPGVADWTVKRPLATALATFGIIGVGASELISYPYWCLEKGYAKYTGPRNGEPNWADRARGWMKVMHYDALASMVVYTIATLAFYLMGVAVMYKQGLDPAGSRMVATLLEQYVPVFGDLAKWLFLFGAIAVLYSTFLISNAALTRLYPDALKVFGIIDRNNPRHHRIAASVVAVVIPLTQLGIFWSGADPVALVLLGGTMQAVMLPMLAFAALYFRYRLSDARLRPGRAWDILLFVSSLGLILAGVWGAYSKLS